MGAKALQQHVTRQLDVMKNDQKIIEAIRKEVGFDLLDNQFTAKQVKIEIKQWDANYRSQQHRLMKTRELEKATLISKNRNNLYGLMAQQTEFRLQHQATI